MQFNNSHRLFWHHLKSYQLQLWQSSQGNSNRNLGFLWHLKDSHLELRKNLIMPFNNSSNNLFQDLLKIYQLQVWQQSHLKRKSPLEEQEIPRILKENHELWTFWGGSTVSHVLGLDPNLKNDFLCHIGILRDLRGPTTRWKNHGRQCKCWSLPVDARWGIKNDQWKLNISWSFFGGGLIIFFVGGVLWKHPENWGSDEGNCVDYFFLSTGRL